MLQVVRIVSGKVVVVVVVVVVNVVVVAVVVVNVMVFPPRDMFCYNWSTRYGLV